MADLPELSGAPAPLDAAETARLTDFARACKAAARAVVLYPAGHPAIAATLGRIAQITAPAALAVPLRITVLPDSLLLDNRPPARGDAALVELAILLHSHLIGEITVNPGGDVDAWRTFLLLLGRSPESVRVKAASLASGQRWPVATSSCAKSITPKCCANAPAANRRYGIA